MLLTVFITLSIIAAALVIPGFLTETTRFWGYAAVLGSILFVMTGILLNAQGVDIPVGTQVNETTAGYTSQTVFENRQTTVFTALGFGYILGGLAGLTVMVRQMFMDEEDDSINDFSDDLSDGPVDTL